MKDVVSWAFIISVVVSSLLALFIIAFPVVINAFDDTYEVPNVIEEWGGVVIGYYFGSMTTIFLKYFEK